MIENNRVQFSAVMRPMMHPNREDVEYREDDNLRLHRSDRAEVR